MNWYALTAAVILALTHIFAEFLNFSAIPRSKGLSFAGGVSVAFIFIHILPELEEFQHALVKNSQAEGFLKHHIYLIALLGLAVFYGIERAAKLSFESRRSDAVNDEMPHNTSVFWLHISSFAAYNFIIGYLLVHREMESLMSLLWFTVALAFHFVVNDYGLMDHYQTNYRKNGRWLLSLAVVGGCLIGSFTEIKEFWISILFAFVAGSTILNVLKEELPEERKSNFWAFALGIILYSVLLLAA